MFKDLYLFLEFKSCNLWLHIRNFLEVNLIFRFILKIEGQSSSLGQLGDLYDLLSLVDVQHSVIESQAMAGLNDEECQEHQSSHHHCLNWEQPGQGRVKRKKKFQNYKYVLFEKSLLVRLLFLWLFIFLV